MTIAVGDTLPNASFRTRTSDGMNDLSTDDIFKDRTVVLFGVPGAFTPTCTLNHLPGFLDHNDEIRAKGVDEIAVVSANDAFVLGIWKEHTNADGKILFLADGNCEFIKAAGLDIDMSAGGMGTRSKRFSMIVRDRVVEYLAIEDSPGAAEETSAEKVLANLQ